jgi:F-type H+-transporting ATPase subunit b
MKIDWLTFAAQTVNFLVLVWLLRRFLYRPVTRAMARREARIAERLQDAERRRQEAEAEAARYREMERDLDARRDALLDEARRAAEEERRGLERAAREDVEARHRTWLEELDTRHETFLHELRGAATERFWALARRALGDLGDAQLEEHIALAFARQVEALDEDTTRRLAEECARTDTPLVLRSRFPLSAAARRQVTRALHDRLGLEARIDHQVSEDLGCGVELVAGGRVLRWNLDAYLDGFEAEVSALVAEAGRAAAMRAAS